MVHRQTGASGMRWRAWWHWTVRPARAGGADGRPARWPGRRLELLAVTGAGEEREIKD